MWNPTQQEEKAQAAAIAAEVSGNKKKKEFEECQCTSAEFVAANSGCLAGDNCSSRLSQISKQQQDAFVNNSKNNRNLKLGKELEAEDEAIDSGFISGPQTSSSLLLQDNDVQQQLPKNNITVPEQQQQQQQQEKRSSKQQETNTILDSGCIEAEDDDFCDDADIDVNVDANVKVSDAAETVNAEVKRQFVAQVKPELPKATVAAVAASTIDKKTTSTNDQMRFKNNVDSGIAERFCSLSLQTGGAGINNLNAAPCRSNTAPLLQESSNTSLNNIQNPQHQHEHSQQSLQIPSIQQPQQQQQQSTKANIARLSDWEEFYQQNSDGDT